MTGNRTSRSVSSDGGDGWKCDEHTWVSAGVTISDGMMTRVWTCANCPGWTQEGYGRKYEIEYHETEMHTADYSTKTAGNEKGE